MKFLIPKHCVETIVNLPRRATCGFHERFNNSQGPVLRRSRGRFVRVELAYLALPYGMTGPCRPTTDVLRLTPKLSQPARPVSQPDSPDDGRDRRQDYNDEGLSFFRGMPGVSLSVSMRPNFLNCSILFSVTLGIGFSALTLNFGGDSRHRVVRML